MKRAFGPITLAYPMPAFLVGSYDVQGMPNIMTAAWGGICCSTPPCVAVSVRPERWTHQAITERKAFTLSIPSARMAAETDYAGIISGKRTDKFAAAGLTATRSSLVDAPYVEECPVILECALQTALELGSHTQFIGRIVNVSVDEECLGQEGAPDVFKIDPLIYDGGEKRYHRIGEAVGQAFSIGKTVKNA